MACIQVEPQKVQVTLVNGQGQTLYRYERQRMRNLNPEARLKALHVQAQASLVSTRVCRCFCGLNQLLCCLGSACIHSDSELVIWHETRGL